MIRANLLHTTLIEVKKAGMNMAKTFGNIVKSSKAHVSGGNLTPQSRRSSAGTSIYASTVLRLVLVSM